MVTLLMKVIATLIFHLILCFEKSVRGYMRSNGSREDIVTVSRFDFRDLVFENSVYSPFKNICPLRIYGGISADISDIPYQVVLRKGNKRGTIWFLTCSGSIITRRYILTAAHCFTEVSRKLMRRYRAVAGTNKSNHIIYDSDYGIKEKLPSVEIWRKILHCYHHARYNKRFINHDLAVLELEYPVYFSFTVQPIPMLRDALGITLEEKRMCLVSGYGLMENRRPSPGLRMVCVPLVSRTKCKRYYGKKTVTQYQVCAGRKGRDSCQGDSGGPLTYEGYLIGIVSYGGKCGAAPGVYTLVSAYTTGDAVPFVENHCVSLSKHCCVFLVLLMMI